MSPKIVRTSTGHCCDWCMNLVGVYNYEDVSNTGNDVFRRHKYCRCNVDFIPSEGKRQNVHSKQWYKHDEDEIEKEINKCKRQEEYLIDKKIINSNEYRRKFDKITDDNKLNRLIYSKAKEMLYHRNGTRIEDMYWFDLKTREVIAKRTCETKEGCIRYTKQISRKIKDNKNLITIHTHPSNTPPSVEDLNSSIIHGYKKGVVVTHNGRVFLYEAGEKEKISSRLNLMSIAKYKKLGYTEFEAQMKALEEICESFDVKVEELL